MSSVEAMETEQFICSVFSLPKLCYSRFNKSRKEFLSVGQRFLVTLEKFHKLIKTEGTEDLQELKNCIKNLEDAEAVQVTIFGEFHDEISSRNLVTARNDKYLKMDCVPSRIQRNEWMAKSAQHTGDDGKPIVHIYMVYVHKKDNLQELAINIQNDKELFDLPTIKNLLFLVGLDPSIERKDPSIYTFEMFLRSIFHDTNTVEERPGKDFQVIFVSSLFEDLISSEGKLPMMIQQHLEWQVIQPLLKIRDLIEVNFRTYRKNSEEALQGPDVVYEFLKQRFLEMFKNDPRCIISMLFDKLCFREGMVDCEKMTHVLLEVLAQVLQYLMVEVLAKVYGIKDYRLHQMLEEMVFQKECINIIKDSFRDSLLKSLPPDLFHYECKVLQEEEERKKICELFSKTDHESFLKELEKVADNDLKKLANRVHEELQKRVMAIERNLAVQHKLRFETESILKETIAAHYISNLLPSSSCLSEGLKGDLLRTKDVTGVAMVFGELHIHVIDCSEEQKKVISEEQKKVIAEEQSQVFSEEQKKVISEEQKKVISKEKNKVISEEQKRVILEGIKKTIAKHKYWHTYKIGFITKKPDYYHSVGIGLISHKFLRRGTLGGFMTDLDNNLYCLTCAHVIPEGNVDVYIENNGQTMIGQSVNVEIPPGVPPDVPPLSVDAVDITAVKVKPDQIPRCNPFFKTPDDSYGPCQMLPALDYSFGEHHHVYKWGARTNLTYGTLHTGYYNNSLFKGGVLDKYTYILVEPLPVDDGPLTDDDKPLLVDDESFPVDDTSSRYFAKPGDSGAIICAEGEGSCVQTIAVVQGGEMHVKETISSINYSIGFYLWCALDKLMMRSNLDLCAVHFDEAKLQQCLRNRLHIANNYYP
ncbi:hypothetical protein ACJMK2_011779 [Sinanodonta woodiana]|uniref:Uncharacterized protein n=1 Tax=Sinanodonta woodiana TaxID=1069815 RepID=A0ABD3V931_SINWO